MEQLREGFQMLRGLCSYSKWVLLIGGLLAALCLWGAMFAYAAAPLQGNFIAWRDNADALLEAAPACLASATCAALICDLATRSQAKK